MKIYKYPQYDKEAYWAHVKITNEKDFVLRDGTTIKSSDEHRLLLSRYYVLKVYIFEADIGGTDVLYMQLNEPVFDLRDRLWYRWDIHDTKDWIRLGTWSDYSEDL